MHTKKIKTYTHLVGIGVVEIQIGRAIAENQRLSVRRRTPALVQQQLALLKKIKKKVKR